MSLLWKSKLVIAIGSIILGLFVGALGGYYWLFDNLEAMNEVGVLARVSSEAEAVLPTYVGGNPEVGMYALQRYISLLESYKDLNLRVLDKKVLAWDISIGYVRLGNLAEKAGKGKEAAVAFANALIASRQTGRELKSLAELRAIVDASLKMNNNESASDNVHSN